MENSKIVMVGTPSGRRNIIYDILKKYYKSIEYIYIDLDNKINGYSADLIEIDSITCRNKIDYKICGDCEDFGELSEQQSESLNGKKFGCKTSFIEAKYGNKNTPACSEFKKRGR